MMNHASLPARCVRLLCGVALGAAVATAATPSYADGAATAPDAVTADGGKYYGALVDGKFERRGKIEWDNGARYEGGFEHGLFSGHGRLQDANGAVYEGQFQNGKLRGQGRVVNIDGSVYVGQFDNGLFNGNGKLTMAGGMVFEGAFVNNVFSGQGKYSSTDEQYSGDFKRFAYDGHGELKYTNGNKYQGDFAAGKFQGKGRFETPDGKVYEGQFEQNIFKGQGSYHGPDGSEHVGSFDNWRPQGAGIYTDAKGNVYEGIFTDGALEGEGKWRGKDGARYEGAFNDWKFEGRGVLHSANGDEYRGEFDYGMMQGEGVMTYAVPQKDGRTQDSGTWEWGTLQNPAAQKQLLANVETALYNQPSLLDQTLAALQPHQPGKINMYLLAVGGDGHQEVFRREAEFVQKQFDRDFGTAGRSAVLVNSRNTVAQHPMATMTSIRAAVNAIASRMDKENDILFLFLTSHGSRTHELVLEQDGISLANLPAAELGTLLKSSGIRWKVVVVSACFAGGFIAPLKDPHTLVITAARMDRSSFGCADDAEFTYFSQAYFRDAVPASPSFVAAFEQARKLVKAREEADFKEEEQSRLSTKTPEEGKGRHADADARHSEPQIDHAAPIDAYLKKWRTQLATPALETKAENKAENKAETQMGSPAAQ